MNKQQRYTPEFRSEAVKLELDQGLSQSVAAKRLGVPERMLANWMAVARSSSKPSVPGSRSAAELETENARLRKELAKARMERDILKRPRRTLPGSRCPVRVHEKVAALIFYSNHEPLSVQRGS
jgi:transposase-like protein